MIPIIAAAINAPPWVKKLVAFGLVVVGIMLTIHWYGSSKINEGMLKERIRQHDIEEKLLLDGQKTIHEDLAKLREINVNHVTTSEVTEVAIRADIATLEHQLIVKLAELTKIREKRDEEIDRIPPSELSNTIREQSRKLAEQPQPPDDD
jgi:hypothetical protein